MLALSCLILSKCAESVRMPANLSKRVDETLQECLQRLTEYALRLVPPSTSQAAQLVAPRRGLYLLRQHQRTEFEATIYSPMLCLILQGCKEMTFGEHHFRLRAGECALVSHDLPIVSRVRDAPYLVLLLDIEVDVLRSLYEDTGEKVMAATEARAVEVHQADSHLLDAMGRYLALAESDTDARVLGPMLLRELHYRLMMAPVGHMLRSLLRHDSHASSISRAIALLRRDFRSPMVVEELAREVGMSVSSFHKHFKAVTTTSPLQYQKGLRLLEARRMLVAGAASVTTVAFEVGYESPSQFSREYTRRFGRPPSQDVAPRAHGAS
ncbi:AraC family transcriptional regulator [Myxococcus stipitatus]|uniref:AraC family transcriptional regulator n=1 Tax=Myxococcus stipitatus TaxID=83455 RepID=UPI001F23D6EB|nr:AraC family transcriptional regulator [Myxococcus stipitatus]MCE9673995.1 AraC family transcriptional regulator [Myxococcus stipitatus]